MGRVLLGVRRWSDMPIGIQLNHAAEKRRAEVMGRWCADSTWPAKWMEDLCSGLRKLLTSVIAQTPSSRSTREGRLLSAQPPELPLPSPPMKLFTASRAMYSCFEWS
jgi:hypothetical protein